jgi:hypothetical protein
MRVRGLLMMTIGVVGALVASQPGAGRPAARNLPPVQTVATVRGDVLDFAQDGHYLAWLLPVGVVVMRDLRTGLQTKVPANPDRGSEFPPRGLALVGDRAYWEQIGLGISSRYAEVVTASVHDRRQRLLEVESVDIDLPSDALLPVVTDGANAYLWAGGDPLYVGPIVRFHGLQSKRFSKAIHNPAALAGGGGRVARAVSVYENAGAPAWSPDGMQIAYTRSRIQDQVPRDELWLVNADGTNAHMIASHGSDPDWSPDGTKLAYGDVGNKVVVANADGTDPQVVTFGADPAWSPDGLKLAVVSDGGIWTVALNGQGPASLVIAPGSAPDWSPDGRELVYGRGDPVEDAVWLANADGTNKRMLAPSGGTTSTPAWSPDGTEIAWVSDECGLGNLGICEIHPDGTGERAVPFGKNNLFDRYAPAWGPTAKSLAYVSYGANLDAHVYVWPGQRQVTRSPQEEPIVVTTGGGRKVAQLESSGTVRALAVSRRVVAALISDVGHQAIEIYQPMRRIVPLAGSAKKALAISGTTLVFQVGHTIEALDALKGSPRPVAQATSRAIGLSIVGRRIAWAEKGARGTRIRELELPLDPWRRVRPARRRPPERAARREGGGSDLPVPRRRRRS